VLLVSSEQANEVCNKIGLSLLQLLTPFSLLKTKVEVQTPDGRPFQLTDFNVQFVTLNELQHLQNDIELDKALKDTLLDFHPQISDSGLIFRPEDIPQCTEFESLFSASQIGDKSPWFNEALIKLQRAALMQNFTTLFHPVAVVVAVSSQEKDIIGQLSQLYRRDKPPQCLQHKNSFSNCPVLALILHSEDILQEQVIEPNKSISIENKQDETGSNQSKEVIYHPLGTDDSSHVAHPLAPKQQMNQLNLLNDRSQHNNINLEKILNSAAQLTRNPQSVIQGDQFQDFLFPDINQSDGNKSFSTYKQVGIDRNTEINPPFDAVFGITLKTIIQNNNEEIQFAQIGDQTKSSLSCKTLKTVIGYNQTQNAQQNAPIPIQSVPVYNQLEIGAEVPQSFAKFPFLSKSVSPADNSKKPSVLSSPFSLTQTQSPTLKKEIKLTHVVPFLINENNKLRVQFTKVSKGFGFFTGQSSSSSNKKQNKYPEGTINISSQCEECKRIQQADIMFMLGGTNAALSLYKTLEKDLDEARLVNHAAFARVMVIKEDARHS
ncbi:MAG: hypothetical protein EZS28_009083, partial [Streblomastix strix]